MTSIALATVLLAAPLELELDVLGGLVPNHTYHRLASVTLSGTLHVSDHLGWELWGAWLGAWDKKLTAELKRVAVSQGADVPSFSRPGWLAGVNAHWRIPYDDDVESRLFAGPLFLTQADVGYGARFGGGLFVGGGLRFGFGHGLSGIADVGGMVYSLAERPIDVRYLLTVRLGVGFAI